MMTGATSGRNAATGASRIAATSRGSGTNAGRRSGDRDDRRDEEVARAGSRARRGARHLDAGGVGVEADLLLGLAQRGRDGIGIAGVALPPGSDTSPEWWSAPYSTRWVRTRCASPSEARVDEHEGGGRPGIGRRCRPLERNAVGQPLRAQPGGRRREGLRRDAEAGGPRRASSAHRIAGSGRGRHDRHRPRRPAPPRHREPPRSRPSATRDAARPETACPAHRRHVTASPGVTDRGAGTRRGTAVRDPTPVRQLRPEPAPWPAGRRPRTRTPTHARPPLAPGHAAASA